MPVSVSVPVSVGILVPGVLSDTSCPVSVAVCCVDVSGAIVLLMLEPIVAYNNPPVDAEPTKAETDSGKERAIEAAVLYPSSLLRLKIDLKFIPADIAPIPNATAGNPMAIAPMDAPLNKA